MQEQEAAIGGLLGPCNWTYWLGNIIVIGGSVVGGGGSLYNFKLMRFGKIKKKN